MLPYPPSVNHAYMMRNGKKILKQEVAEYKHSVSLMVSNAKQKFGNVPLPFQMFVYVYPPDKRKRDLDNIIKVMQDGVCLGLKTDDSNIVSVAAIRCDAVKHGMVEIVFTECNADVWSVRFGKCHSDRIERFDFSLPDH